MAATTSHILLTLLSFAAAAASPAASFFASLARTASVAELPPHAPFFSVTLERVALIGSAGEYDLPVHVIRDKNAGGVVVATYYERDSFLFQTNSTGPGLGELQLLAPTPQLAPLLLPQLERVGWAWLFGAKATTITWLDCCAVTGDSSGVSIVASADGSSVLLSQWQHWVPTGSHPNRTAVSVHNFTLAWDPVYGYSIDADLFLRINAAAAPKQVEFLNFLTPHLINPWPTAQLFPWRVEPSGAPLPPAVGPWPVTRPTVTAWANDTEGAAWTGFADNPLAGAELGKYAMNLLQGATLMVTPGAYAPAIAYGAEPASGLSFSQETCPTWADQHQVVTLPPPAADGFITATPTFSIRWVPPTVSAYVLAHLTLLHSSPSNSSGPRWMSSNMLEVGVTTRFDQQPFALTEPRRALVQPHYMPDYVVLHGENVGVNGSNSAWRVDAREPASAQADSNAFASAQPLIPLNASTRYDFSAWCKLVPNTTTPSAMLWLGIFEADDFNFQLSAGPSYGRLAYMNSSVLTAEGLLGSGQLWTSSAVRTDFAPVLHKRPPTSPRAAPGAWMLLSITFTSPSFPSYADLRPIVLGDAGGALYDEWTMVQAFSPTGSDR